MKVVVCDASPLVFLAKLDRLSLIPSVLGGSVFVLKCIADEVLSDSAGPQERARLDEFLERVQIVDFEVSRPPSRSLSRSDQAVLVWAIDNRADWLVADERMLRRIAVAEGIRVRFSSRSCNFDFLLLTEQKLITLASFPTEFPSWVSTIPPGAKFGFVPAEFVSNSQ